MKRIIDTYLAEWKDHPYRKPLLLRGARQVGKTYAARQLGTLFENIVEINFEAESRFHQLFEADLDPAEIIRNITYMTGKAITPGKTLLFFDEIQGVPRALTALRYFYERMPALHVIAAGSLIDFSIQMVGIPVGRVSSLYMYPLSFLEFLDAVGHPQLIEMILSNGEEMPVSQPIHEKTLALLGEYIAVGGLPEAVARWRATRNIRFCLETHHDLLITYRQDFEKYAKKFQIKYLNALFTSIPHQIGTKFKYGAVEGAYRARELSPCIDLLTTAGILHLVIRSAGHGLPLGAESDPSDFKALFLDVALVQTMLGLDLHAWFLEPHRQFINKGALVETLVGQEILSYTAILEKQSLFYWRRNARGSEAEVDYLVQGGDAVIPIEVKSGAGSTLKSMHAFLESHPASPYGLRFSTQNYSTYGKIRSQPLYAVAAAVTSPEQRRRLLALI
ncbi:MAG: AAA family ATPase [Candidatus Dependentiae bacterium]|nr:AAA family ATPase [Candidatus Dependentiae bacterium]